MSTSQQIISFRGGISCRRDDDGPLGLTLIGETAGSPVEVTTVAFAAIAPADLPEVLEDATVERIGANRYRISSGRREWIFPATAMHVHREVSTTFYRAVIPRAAPWNKRLFWRFVLALARSAAGRRLLLALRRR